MATLSQVDFDPFSPLEHALKDEGINGPKADIARSIYQQESGGGKNTKTSNAGARGGMQVIPATFNRMADKGWSIDDPVQNARAGVRYISLLHDKADGDPALTAAGYYGGEGAIAKAKNGVAVSDPRNPKAPNTLQYGTQVAARLPKGGAKLKEVNFDPFAQDAPNAQPAAPSKPFGQQMNEGIADIPRQIGLTARMGLQGVGNIADMVASPIRGAINLVLPEKYAAKPGSANRLADAIGLPQPKNATERIVGNVGEMMVGGALPIVAAGRIAQGATGATKSIAQLMAANPAQQMVSAGSAGGAGGYVRETGGNDTSQMLASLAAGVAAPYAIGKVQRTASAINRLAQGRPVPNPAQIDITINSAMQQGQAQGGMAFGDLSQGIQEGIRKDVADAYRITGTVTPDAIRRLADYRLTGAMPTAAGLTQNPAIVSQQKNLAKQGINSKDVAAQALGQTENANNRQLISGLNDLGANTADTAIAGGRRIMGALESRNARAGTLIDGRYAAARATDGRSAALDPSHFTQSANNLLDEALLGGKLPADVRNLLNRAATGNMPLTVDVAEQFKTRIGDLQRSTTDMAERKALGLVRQALDDTPLLQGQNIGQESIDAFNKARKLNRAWMGIVERTPALQAVRDGIEPDKFVQQFITGNGGKSNAADLAALQRSVKSSPDAVLAVKQQITAHLKSRALNGAADEVGNLSQSAYNKALNGIGNEKLRMFFPQSEVDQLRAIGRVASYEQVQPRGAAVGNSNTGAVMMSSVLDLIAGSPLLSKIPFGSALSQPVQNIAVGINSARAMNVPNALTGSPMTRPMETNWLPMSPAALIYKEDKKE